MFLENGVPTDIFDKYYNDPNDTRAIKTFDPWKQIKRINGEMGIDAEKLTRLVNEYIADMSAYVFADVPGFVHEIGDGNICIVSFGEKEFQTKKIMNSKISEYIKDIVITESSKAEEIENILEKECASKNEKIFFLDDRIEQIHDVKEKFPDIITIFVKRPEGRYQEMAREECCNFEVHSLKEAENIIKRIAQKND